MRMFWIDPAYEAARTWAVHPASHPPPGWAQIVRGGIVTWIRQAHPPMPAQAPEPHRAHFDCSPLLTLVAAMIEEVCR